MNQTLIQPWVAYALNEEWYVFTDPILIANWEEDDSDQRWVVPVGGGVGRTFYMGKQAVDIAATYYYHVERPDNAPKHVLRFTIQFFWPK